MGTWPNSSWTQSLKRKTKKDSTGIKFGPNLKNPTQINLTKYRLCDHKLAIQSGCISKQWLQSEKQLYAQCETREVKAEVRFLTDGPKCEKQLQFVSKIQTFLFPLEK